MSAERAGGDSNPIYPPLAIIPLLGRVHYSQLFNQGINFNHYILGDHQLDTNACAASQQLLKRLRVIKPGITV